jgi:Fe-S-cluster containining protein
MKRSTRREVHRRLPAQMYLSESLRDLMRRCDEQGKEVAAQMLLHYDAAVQRALAQHPDRLGIAVGAHEATDRTMQALMARDPNAGQVKCRKGCAACCHIKVDVSRSEAQLLAACAADLGLPIDRERLRKQAAGYEGLAPEDRACVFLKDGACGVYEHRPGACRKMLVVTDPDLCDTVKHPGGKVGHLVSAEAEVIWSVLLTRDECGTLPVMLQRELDV